MFFPSKIRIERESGHLLLAVLLMMALMVIAAVYEAPRVVQQLKRDREEEMIHRGTEYARAIKKFYKKFGRYPTGLEQLDNTNNIRFIRKRYKDPLTKDGKWTLLRYADIASIVGQGGGPGTPAAALGAQGRPGLGPSASQPGSATPGSSGGFGTSNFGAGTPQSSGGINQNNASTQVQGPQVSADQQQQSQGFTIGGGAVQGQGTPAGSSDSPQPNSSGFGSSSSFGASATSNATGNSATPGGTAATANSEFGSGSQTGGQTFGGGAIVGVASLSKDPTIRVYNKKKTYNEWQFIYSPTMDVANVLLRGPYSPTTISNTNIGTPAGQLNQSNQQQSPFGQQNSGGFGQQQPSGFGNQQQQVTPGQQFPPDQNH